MERNTRTKIAIAGVAVAAVVGIGVGIAAAGGGGGGDDREGPITGAALDRASEVALDEAGGGQVTDTETGDEDSYYEVEVTLDDGSQVDVQLNRDFNVIGSSIDRPDGDDRDDREGPITGEALDRASEVALEHAGGGRVTDTETGDEDSYYEVEVTLDDGSQVDVQLDRDFNVIGSSIDREDRDDRDDDSPFDD